MLPLTLLTVAVFLILPAMILKARHQWRWVDALGPVVVAYGVGIALGQVLPAETQDVVKSLSEAAVPLSIPLLLFSQNPRTAFVGAGRMLICFLLAALAASLSASAVSAYWLLSGPGASVKQFPEFWQVAGMLVGTYTGGTPNMAFIGLAVGVPDRIFLMSTAADTLLGGVYLMIIVSVAQPLLRHVLPHYAPVPPVSALSSADQPIKKVTTPLSWPDILKGLALSAVISAASIGGSLALTGSLSVPIIMLLLTALALAVACIPQVNQWSDSYATGEYLILIFCLAIGAMIRFDTFAWDNLYLFVFAAAVMSLGIVMHLMLSRLFKIDSAHFLLASTAAVFGPPFVGVVARAIQAPQLVASGLAVGVLGYALGNYLGLLVAYGVHYFI